MSTRRTGTGIIVIEADDLEAIECDADVVRMFKDPGDQKWKLFVAHHNAYVNTGLNNSLDREFGLGGTAIGFIGVDNDNTAVTAATPFLHGSATAAVGNNTVASGATAGGATVTLTSAAGVQKDMGFGFQAGGATVEVLTVLSVAANVVTFTTNLQFTHTNGTRVDWVGAAILAISPAATRTAQTTTGGASFVNASFAAGSPTLQNLVPVWNKLGFLTTSTDAGTGLVDVIGGAGGTSPYNRTFNLNLTNAGVFTAVAQIAVTGVAV